MDTISDFERLRANLDQAKGEWDGVFEGDYSEEERDAAEAKYLAAMEEYQSLYPF